MCDPISMGLMIFGGVSNAQNELSQGEMEAAGYNISAKQVEWQRDQDIRRLREEAGKFSESQKATMAASGVDIGSVSGQDILLDTKNQVALDEMAIKYNANLQALQLRTQEKMAKKAGQTRATNTILGTAGQVANSWYNWKNTSAGARQESNLSSNGGFSLRHER